MSLSPVPNCVMPSQGAFLRYKYPQFYEFAGVTVLTRNQVFEKFLVTLCVCVSQSAVSLVHTSSTCVDYCMRVHCQQAPNFSSLSVPHRDETMEFIRRNWSTLDTPALRAVLTTLPFVPVCTGRSLLDRAFGSAQPVAAAASSIGSVFGGAAAMPMEPARDREPMFAAAPAELPRSAPNALRDPRLVHWSDPLTSRSVSNQLHAL